MGSGSGVAGEGSSGIGGKGSGPSSTSSPSCAAASLALPYLLVVLAGGITSSLGFSRLALTTKGTA